MFRRAPFIVIAFLVLLATTVWAKGATVKIVVRGNDLAEPVIITDDTIVSRFNIWSGPSSKSCSKGAECRTDYSGNYIDFPSGIVPEPPAGQLEFEVEFFVASARDGTVLDETYKVRYAMIPGEAGGFFYVPMGNSFIYHGIEDNWLKSAESWEILVRPVIESSLQAN